MLMSIQHLHALHLTSSHLKHRLYRANDYFPVPNKSLLTAEQVWVLNMVFEEVTITKSAWGAGLCDVVAWNAAQMEEVAHLDLDFEQILVEDGDQDEWDKSMPGSDSDWY